MKPDLRGLMEAHAYPLVSLRSGCFFPVGQSHTAAQHTDIAWTSLSQACSSHFGTDEHLIRGPQRERCPSCCFTAAWALASAVIWTNVCRVRSVHEKKDIHVHYIHTHTRASLSPSLSASGACMVASWWVQLGFHTQLGSSSNGDWHVPVNPLHTAATVGVYIPDLYYIISGGWWQMTKKKWLWDDLCVAHGETGCLSS